MIHRIATLIATAAGAVAVCSTGYYVLCLWSAARCLIERKGLAKPGGTIKTVPPVSVLKPLKGTDPEMYENLRSHCVQEDSEYEIIFGVSDPSDSAIQVVERLRREFPQRAISLVVCPKRLGPNTKVSNLAQMLGTARYKYIVVNDSDIRVPRDYLQRITSPLANPQVGMVTCLYRGVPNSTLGSQLESLGISTDFSAGVLAARQLEGAVRFGLGSTLVLRRRDLEMIGGFEALVDYLGDDYEIGRRIAERGLKVELSDVVLETFLPLYTLRQFLEHQQRWGRTIRDSRRWGYFGLVVTFGWPWAVLALILSHGTLWAWKLLALVVALRLAVAIVTGRFVLQDHKVLTLLPLLPLRDLVALLVWIGSLVGHKVIWRGDSFTLEDGKLVRIKS